MLWTSDLPTTGMGWKFVLGEVVELFIEIIHLNLHGIISEACDVYTCAMCALETTIGRPVPILWRRTYNEWLARVEVWKEIFADHGLEWHVRYISGGGNYRRPEKIRVALDMARTEQQVG